MALSRRRFLQLTGLGALGLGRPSRAAGLLPVPFLERRDVLRFVACLRPYRQGSFRLETEPGPKLLVHNYGHGGAGYTLSWGCAREVLELVRPSPGRVAVLGSGVIGLTSARLLREAGREVTIYAAVFPPHTTSDKAGALFGPAGVAHRDQRLFERVLGDTYRDWGRLEGAEWAVRAVDTYDFGQKKSFWSKVPPGLLPTRTLARAPFESATGPATVYRTYLIEPPTFLPRLMAELRQRQVAFVRRRFDALEQVFELPEEVVVNCTGLGSYRLCRDEALVPIRGQLVHLKPQKVDYCITRGPYMFPRSDVLLLGGTYEKDVWTAVPEPSACERILWDHQRFFGGWFTPFSPRRPD